MKIGIPIGVAALYLAAAPVHAQTLEQKNVTVVTGGAANQVDKLPYWIALYKGFFRDEGLNADSINFPSGIKGIEALAADGAQANEGAPEHIIRTQSRGIELKCIVGVGRYPGNVLMVVKGKEGEIKRVADLKGRNIGVSSPGSATNNFVASLLERAGVNWRDASYIATGGGASAIAAARTASVDAIVTLDPAVTEMVSSGDTKVLIDSRTQEGTIAAYGGPYLANCLMVKADFAKANPGTTQALANAMVRSMQWIRGASVDEIMASFPPDATIGNRDVYRTALERSLPSFDWDGVVTEESIKTVFETIAMVDPSIRNAKVDLAKVFDNAFVERALLKYKPPQN